MRSKRISLVALSVLVALHLLSARFQMGVIRGGWSLVLAQASIQGTIPLKRPLPTTYVIRNEAFVRTSGLPIEGWFRFSSGVVFAASVPLWSLALVPFCRFLWCGYRLAFDATIARCERCGYNMAASNSGVCPECGWRRDWLKAFRRGLLDRF